MNWPPNQLVLLDTSALVHLIRQEPIGRAIEKQLQLSQRPERPLFSSITEGEMLGLARIWKWGPTKLAALSNLLRELVRVDAGHREITAAYADLYADACAGGHPHGENDTWIAATAKATGATLVTCDHDFDWMQGRHITRVYVGE